MIYATFLAGTAATELTVPMVSLRDGLLLEMAGQVSGRRGSEFPRQVVAAARALGAKFNYDDKHANHVARLALQLFDELHEEHQLGNRERLMLEVAAILHDIGVFIGNTAHHKHGRYIICESDLFGLRKGEKEIVADVVRYHRKATPRPTHIEYMSLPRPERVVVSKLAAILRVADALDRAHLQRIKDVRVERRRDSFVLMAPTAEDLSVERSGLKSKGDLFEEVFGFTVVLEEAPASG
jgi:exopolyphosphatase/guanosine-5'-triphosphate,3'-diphosphate pyrophosphatase